MTIECTNYKPVNKGSLLGYADFFMARSRMEIYGCGVYQKDGHRWVNMPSREYTNADGEKKFLSIVRFREKSVQQAFSDAALKAVDEKIKLDQKKPEQKYEVQDDLPF